MGGVQPASSGEEAEKPVAVCADAGPLRDRICSALTAGGHSICGVESKVAALVDACADAPPVCAVMAMDRPDRDAARGVRLIRSAFDGVAVVLVCRRARGAEVRLALQLGADGVILETETEEALAAVVAVVRAGQVSVPSGKRSEVRAKALTTREKQILALVVAGLTNAQIAGKLYLAESTVKSHLSSAFSKLGVSSRYEATSVVLDPERGRGLGIREIQAERLPLGA